MKYFVCLALAALLTGCGSRESATESLNRAVILLENNKDSEALPLTAKAAAALPENADAQIIRAIALERAGEYDKAVESAKKATVIAPASFAAQYTLGRLYAANRNSWYDAVVTLGKALELRDGDLNTLILLANVNMNLNSDQAQKYLVALARDRVLSQTPEYMNQLAICLVRKRNYKSAGDMLLRACRADQNNPQLLFNLAMCMDRYLNKGQVAAKLYRSFLQKVPDDAAYASGRKIAEARIKALTPQRRR